MEDLKERIEKKLDENIERILSKDELDKNDVGILNAKLFDIEREKEKEESKEKLNTLMNPEILKGLIK